MHVTVLLSSLALFTSTTSAAALHYTVPDELVEAVKEHSSLPTNYTSYTKRDSNSTLYPPVNTTTLASTVGDLLSSSSRRSSSSSIFSSRSPKPPTFYTAFLAKLRARFATPGSTSQASQVASTASELIGNLSSYAGNYTKRSDNSTSGGSLLPPKNYTSFIKKIHARSFAAPSVSNLYNSTNATTNAVVAAVKTGKPLQSRTTSACTYPDKFTVSDLTTYTTGDNTTASTAASYISFEFADSDTSITTWCSYNASSVSLATNHTGLAPRYACDDSTVSFIWQSGKLTAIEKACVGLTGDEVFEASGSLTPTGLTCSTATNGTTCVAAAAQSGDFTSLEPSPL